MMFSSMNQRCGAAYDWLRLHFACGSLSCPPCWLRLDFFSVFFRLSRSIFPVEPAMPGSTFFGLVTISSVPVGGGTFTLRGYFGAPIDGAAPAFAPSGLLLMPGSDCACARPESSSKTAAPQRAAKRNE